MLQNLPASALLIPGHGTGLLAVECDPQIITLPGAAAELTVPEGGLAAPDYPAAMHPAAGPGSSPELAAPRPQPASQLWRGSPDGSAPAWPPRGPTPDWPRPRG